MAYDPTDWSTADSTAYDTAQHFFIDPNGAHVTETAGYPNVGKNVLIDSNGMYVRDGTTNLAEFGSTVKLLDSTGERSLTMTGTGFTVIDETNTMLGFMLECYPGSITNMAAVGDVVITGQNAGFNGNNNVEVRATTGDATIRSTSGDVIVRTVNFTVQDSTGTQLWSGTAQQLADALNGLAAYPVGSIYMSVNNTDPGTIFGGTWERLEDRFLLGAGSTYTAGDTGGSATHNHYKAESGYNLSNVKNVAGSYVVSTGNYVRTETALPPYLVVYMWKRTA